MELQHYLHIIRRYWRSALATVFVCIAFAAASTIIQKPTYTATATVFLIVESGDSAGELSQGATYAERQVKSFIAVTASAVVLQPVIDDLGLAGTPSKLAGSLTVASPSATSIIEITAQDADPQQAAVLVNAVSGSLLDAVDELAPASSDGTRLVSARVIDEALVPATPSAPRPATNLVLGAMLGLLFGIGQALLRSTLDTRIRNADELESLTDAPVLAAIGHSGAQAGRSDDPYNRHGGNAEAYRRLRTNIGFVGLGGERRNSMVITSSVAGEGKTETAVNLAKVLALAGERVLLIDADLRRPQIAARMRIDSEFGLTDVLTGRARLDDLTIDVIPGYLAVLPAGTLPPNPSELLGSDAMKKLLAIVEPDYDFVLIDTPPLLPVTDALILSSETSGAVVVVRSELVRRPQLLQALDSLAAGEIRLLGLVANDVSATPSASYGHRYVPHEAPTESRHRDRANTETMQVRNFQPQVPFDD